MVHAGKFQIGDYVEIVNPISSFGLYYKGDRGFIVRKHGYLGFYAVEFDNGASAIVYTSEMADVKDEETEGMEETYMILAPLFTFQITPCGADAPDTWFDHSNGNFLNSERLQQVLDGYRSAGVVVV